MTRPRAAESPPNRLDRWALGVLMGFTFIAVAGYWIFALHPERIPSQPFAIRLYQVSFAAFAQAHIVVAGLALAVVLLRHAGPRWLPALGVTYLLSFLAEHVGTGTGFPFSGYAYTGLLGPKLGGRVPALIPLSWFLMAGPSWILARALFPTPGRTFARLVTATALLVSWDLALDPAMSHLAPYWTWERPGAFYGMPWINLLGWAGTGIVLMAALEILDRRTDWAGTLSWRWSAGYYLTVLAMPLGMVLAAGLWGAVIATLGALTLVVGAALRFGGVTLATDIGWSAPLEPGGVAVGSGPGRQVP